MSQLSRESSELEAEARIFGRYVVGRAPAPEVVARYGEACRTLWPDGPAPADAARLAFVRRHAWSTGPIDAAAALIDPAGQLRSKVLVTAALLEATTAHADDFLPRTLPLPALFVLLAASGIVAVALALIGLLLWPLAGRSRR